jgi:peptidyl-prolyl cis-trans isomerase SurA
MKNYIEKLQKQQAIVIFILLLSVFFFNCSRQNKTLVSIGDEKITLGEFEKQYLKTINNLDSARNKSLDDKKSFLNLYIKFRLKVKDAREKGILKNPDLQKEIEEYKKSLYPTFLIDKEVTTKEIKKLYDRKREEVRASHILINLAEVPTPQDSIAAYQKADSCIQRLKNGEDFGTLALQYSSDRTVQTNKGDLYYFTGGMTVDTFEDAVYDLSVGEYTKKPVRTIFGLHIIKLTDRRPRLEGISAAHILIQDKRDSVGVMIDSIGTYNKAMEAYNKAKNGEDFGALVTQYSDDPGTKTNKGELGFFDRRRMAQPFDSAAFGLKVGEISQPVRTQYGWHIIKKTGEKPFQPFDKQIENLKNDYKRTKKYKDDYQKYVDGLKIDFNFKLKEEGLQFLKSKFDSTKNLSNYNIDSLLTAGDKNIVLATYKDGDVKVSDFLNNLNTNRDYQRINLTEATLKSIINSTAEQPLLNKKAIESKIEKDDDFIAMLTEYENGLIVFRVDQDELWSKVKIADNDMQTYFDANKVKYTKIDSTGKTVEKSFDESKAEISNELQQIKFKDIENNYFEDLKKKYPVKINEEVLTEAFKE